MGFNDALLKYYFSRHFKAVPHRNVQIAEQKLVFTNLITAFTGSMIGKELCLSQKTTEREFSQVPGLNYNGLEKYIERQSKGEPNVLTREEVLYYVKTSGTSGKAKYIPMTRTSLRNQVDGPKRVLAHLLRAQKFRNLFTEKSLVFSDTSHASRFGNYVADSLSAHLSGSIRWPISTFMIPGKETQREPDLKRKVNMIARDCSKSKVSFAVAMPSWLNAVLSEMNDAEIRRCFTGVQLISFSGMNPHPYIKSISEKLGQEFNWIQTYPSSEGFFAYTDELCTDGMLLMTDQGIYYEFVAEASGEANRQKIPLEEVETGIVYRMIITSSNGLISYSIGDLVEFTSIDPFRIKVVGRTGESVSISGELVNQEQVVKVLCKSLELRVTEMHTVQFLLYPDQDEKGRSFHQWIIESRDLNVPCETFAARLDHFMRDENQNYDDIRGGDILLKPQVRVLEPGTIVTAFQKQENLSLQSKLKRIYSIKPEFVKAI